MIVCQLRGNLIYIDAFGAFILEEDDEGGEAELQVVQHVHVVDVQKVELQFFMDEDGNAMPYSPFSSARSSGIHSIWSPNCSISSL